jgi:ribosomal protein S16
MPISPQEARRRAKEQGVTKAPVQTYIVVDEHFRPNAHGLGGVKPFMKNGKHCLVLTEQQARYWLDAGAIVPEQVPEQPA